MNELQHLMLRHNSAPTTLDARYDDKVAAERFCKPFTEATMRTWLRCAVEPWRLYAEWRPDDMPPKSGSPAKLAALTRELGADPTDAFDFPEG